MIHKNRIKELRTSRGMTQKELGKAVGLTEAAVCRHERLSRGLEKDIIHKYSKALEVKPSELFVEFPLSNESSDGDT